MTAKIIRPLLDGETRHPSSWLNYPGTISPDPHTPLGPNMLGERVWPVTVAETMLPPNKPKGRRRVGTRVGVSLVPPPEETLQAFIDGHVGDDPDDDVWAEEE